MAAGTFEELIAIGCRKFVACGSSGVLKSELKRGAVIIPDKAVRDEGASYHYCPPSREIQMEKAVVKKLEKVLIKHKINYEIGKTWTNDGFYRETKGKVDRRTREGCITVVEHSRREELPVLVERIRVERSRVYGDTKVSLMRSEARQI